MPSDPLSQLTEMISPCRLCPRECLAKRVEGETGYCGMSATPRIASFGPHYGEEPQLVGTGGSGTIFLSGCNLKCVFCQNPGISFGKNGSDVQHKNLVNIMLHLQANGCGNINFVTPTHFAPQIAEAIIAAREAGLSVPIVYNCGGYEPISVLSLLDGLVEIYMPDFKTLSPDWAAKHLNARDYPEVATAALRVMYEQAGGIEIEDGIAVRGTLIRHLVMPGMVDDSKRIIDLIADIAPRALVNIMGQYRPCNTAYKYPALSRRTTRVETEEARRYAHSKGLQLTW